MFYSLVSLRINWIGRAAYGPLETKENAADHEDQQEDKELDDGMADVFFRSSSTTPRRRAQSRNNASPSPTRSTPPQGWGSRRKRYRKQRPGSAFWEQYDDVVVSVESDGRQVQDRVGAHAEDKYCERKDQKEYSLTPLVSEDIDEEIKRTAELEAYDYRVRYRNAYIKIAEQRGVSYAYWVAYFHALNLYDKQFATDFNRRMFDAKQLLQQYPVEMVYHLLQIHREKYLLEWQDKHNFDYKIPEYYRGDVVYLPERDEASLRCCQQTFEVESERRVDLPKEAIADQIESYGFKIVFYVMWQKQVRCYEGIAAKNQAASLAVLTSAQDAELTFRRAINERFLTAQSDMQDAMVLLSAAMDLDGQRDNDEDLLNAYAEMGIPDQSTYGQIRPDPNEPYRRAYHILFEEYLLRKNSEWVEKNDNRLERAEYDAYRMVGDKEDRYCLDYIGQGERERLLTVKESQLRSVLSVSRIEQRRHENQGANALKEWFRAVGRDDSMEVIVGRIVTKRYALRKPYYMWTPGLHPDDEGYIDQQVIKSALGFKQEEMGEEELPGEATIHLLEKSFVEFQQYIHQLKARALDLDNERLKKLSAMHELFWGVKVLSDQIDKAIPILEEKIKRRLRLLSAIRMASLTQEGKRLESAAIDFACSNKYYLSQRTRCYWKRDAPVLDGTIAEDQDVMAIVDEGLKKLSLAINSLSYVGRVSSLSFDACHQCEDVEREEKSNAVDVFNPANDRHGLASSLLTQAQKKYALTYKSIKAMRDHLAAQCIAHMEVSHLDRFTVRQLKSKQVDRCRSGNEPDQFVMPRQDDAAVNQEDEELVVFKRRIKQSHQYKKLMKRLDKLQQDYQRYHASKKLRYQQYAILGMEKHKLITRFIEAFEACKQMDDLKSLVQVDGQYASENMNTTVDLVNSEGDMESCVIKLSDHRHGVVRAKSTTCFSSLFGGRGKPITASCYDNFRSQLRITYAELMPATPALA